MVESGRGGTREKIQQVALVLMVNASEAMPKGGTLQLRTGLGADGENLFICIKDSGCGIPADVLPRIFDPFFTTKEDQLRTGLGLAVAAARLVVGFRWCASGTFRDRDGILPT